MPEQKRDNGYYWVKAYSKSEWKVFLYENQTWWHGDEEIKFKHGRTLFEINETRILSPSEQLK